MSEASGSGMGDPPRNKRRRCLDNSADTNDSGPSTRRSPSGAEGDGPSRSPTPGSKLPASHFLRLSPPAPSLGNADCCKRHAPAPRQPCKFSKLPRYLWPAFGKVHGPVKRHLRRRMCGRRAKRELPWSKAPCVVSLFGVEWIEAADDGMMVAMGVGVSPRPNRTATQPNAAAAAGGGRDRPEGNLDGELRHSDPSGIAREQSRRLSDIMEEEEEEEDRGYLAAERNFVEQYGAELPAEGEFESAIDCKTEHGAEKRNGQLNLEPHDNEDEDKWMDDVMRDTFGLVAEAAPSDSIDEAQQHNREKLKPVRRCLFK